MKITLYYDDCRHYSDEDYPYKTLTVKDYEEFDLYFCDKSDYIRCDDENGYQVLLKKDRIIEVWIGEEE
jgi:hypothetical protein